MFLTLYFVMLPSSSQVLEHTSLLPPGRTGTGRMSEESRRRHQFKIRALMGATLCAIPIARAYIYIYIYIYASCGFVELEKINPNDIIRRDFIA